MDSAGHRAAAHPHRVGCDRSRRDRSSRRLPQTDQSQTAVRTNVTLAVLLDEWLDSHPVERSTRLAYTTLIEKFIRPAPGDQTLPGLVKQGSRPYERLYAELRVCRRHCRGRSFVEHRTPRVRACDVRYTPHVCQPLSASSIRQ